MAEEYKVRDYFGDLVYISGGRPEGLMETIGFGVRMAVFPLSGAKSIRAEAQKYRDADEKLEESEVENQFDHDAHMRNRMPVDFSRCSELLDRAVKETGRDRREILREALGLYSHLDKDWRNSDERFLCVTDRKNKVLAKLKWS